MALLLGAALLAPARPARAAATPADARERARSVLQDPEFQGSLPEQARSEDEEDEEMAESDRPVSRRARPEKEEEDEAAVRGTASMAAMTVYLLVGIAVVLLVVWLLMEGADRKAKEEPGAKPDGGGEGEPEAEGRDFVLDDATRLASQGLYAEAMHVLLLVAIHQVAERSRASLPPSRTSRELVRLLPLGAESRDSFGEMVRAVERTLFGGEAAGAQDYQRSLEHFRHVTGRPA